MEFVRIADKKRVNFITSEIKRVIPAGSSILDVGCGNGIITMAVGSLGYQVTGIDVSWKTIEQAKVFNTLPNVNFKVTVTGEIDPEQGKYDAIICSEVLEHLHDPGSLLRNIHQSLKDEGVLIVTVPNGNGPRELFVTKPVQYLQKKNNVATRFVGWIKNLLGYKGITAQSSADDLSHIQFFTQKTLRALAASTGFRISAIKKTNFIEQVFPFSILIRRSTLLQKMDCAIADRLPLMFTSGFMSIWKKN